MEPPGFSDRNGGTDGARATRSDPVWYLVSTQRAPLAVRRGRIGPMIKTPGGRIKVSFTPDAFYAVKVAFDASLKPAVARSSARPARLLHFTDTEGLLGIVCDRRTRIARARNSNDSMEIQHGLDLATRAIAKRSESGDVTPAAAVLLTEARKLTEFGYGQRYEDGLPVLDAHVACFADGDRSTSDSLLHWALYGRAGRGFAIEFDTAQLKVGGERADLFKVEYDPRVQVAEVEGVIDHFTGDRAETGPIWGGHVLPVCRHTCRVRAYIHRGGDEARGLRS